MLVRVAEKQLDDQCEEQMLVGVAEKQLDDQCEQLMLVGVVGSMEIIVI